MKKINIRNTRWCFTDFEHLKWDEIQANENVRYVGVGEEKCPKTGKIHYQGWIQLINKISMGQLKKIIGSDKIHIETCKGSVEQNELYCGKDGNFVSHGTYVTQGTRTDLNNLKKIIDDGGDILDVAEADFGTFLRYHKGFEKYKTLVEQQNTRNFRKVKVALITGPTGCGKTKRAVESSKNDYFKISGDEISITFSGIISL